MADGDKIKDLEVKIREVGDSVRSNHAVLENKINQVLISLSNLDAKIEPKIRNMFPEKPEKQGDDPKHQDLAPTGTKNDSFTNCRAVKRKLGEEISATNGTPRKTVKFVNVDDDADCELTLAVNPVAYESSSINNTATPKAAPAQPSTEPFSTLSTCPLSDSEIAEQLIAECKDRHRKFGHRLRTPEEWNSYFVRSNYHLRFVQSQVMKSRREWS